MSFLWVRKLFIIFFIVMIYMINKMLAMHEARLVSLGLRQDTLEQGQATINQRLESIEQRLANIERLLNIPRPNTNQRENDDKSLNDSDSNREKGKGA